jgi:hypothetical protein
MSERHDLSELASGTCISCGEPSWRSFEYDLGSVLCIDCLTAESEVQGFERNIEAELKAVSNAWVHLKALLVKDYDPWKRSVLGMDTWVLVTLPERRRFK